MEKTLSVVFDGEVFRPETPPDLEPNTRYQIIVQAAPAISDATFDKLKQLYAFNNEAEVKAFLQNHPTLPAFLETAYSAIKHYFPEAQLSLAVVVAQNSDQKDILELTITTNGDKYNNLFKWNELKSNWWSDQSDEIFDDLLLQIDHPEFSSRNTWAVMDSLIGTVEAPEDWSLEHDHYIHGTPKRYSSSDNA